MGSKFCDKILAVENSKLERNDSKDWWNLVFRILDEDAKIPAHKRLEVLQTVFPNHLLIAIFKICGVTEPKFPEFSKQFTKEVDQCLRPGGIGRIYSASGLSSLIPEYYDDNLDNATTILNKVLNLDPQQKYNEAEALAYLKTRKKVEFNLDMQVVAVVNKIAQEFISWYKTLGDFDEQRINQHDIIEIFEVKFDTHALRSLVMRLKLMTSVPERIAEDRGLPIRSRRAILFGEINRDIEKSRRRNPKKIIFGRHSTKVVFDPPEKIYKTWYYGPNVPEKLESMGTVFEGITNLRSTLSFCQYLIDHPEIKPPKFLVETGLLTASNLQEVASEEDFTVTRKSVMEQYLAKFSKTVVK